jgi:hypothetical protein
VFVSASKGPCGCLRTSRQIVVVEGSWPVKMAQLLQPMSRWVTQTSRVVAVKRTRGVSIGMGGGLAQVGTPRIVETGIDLLCALVTPVVTGEGFDAQ